MFKKLNVLMLTLLIISQTILGPITAVAATVEPVADEQVVEKSTEESMVNELDEADGAAPEVEDPASDIIDEADQTPQAEQVEAEQVNPKDDGGR